MRIGLEEQRHDARVPLRGRLAGVAIAAGTSRLCACRCGGALTLSRRERRLFRDDPLAAGVASAPRNHS